MTRSEAITALYALFNAPHNADINLVGLNVLLDELYKSHHQEEPWPEEPEQEPVAWVYPEGLEALKAGKPWTAYGTRQEPNNTALYLSPQPDIAPYAWVTFTPYGDEDDVWYENPEGQLLEGWTYKPLYDTTPPQRTWVGLSDEEIKAFDTWHDNREEEVGWCNPSEIVAYIEAKLKDKNTRGQK